MIDSNIDNEIQLIRGSERTKLMYWKKIVFALLFVSFGSIKAQNTLYHTAENQHFRRGMELIEKEKFSAAREQFEKFLLTSEDPLKRGDAEYFVAFCALNLDNSDGAELIASFVDARPNHPKAAKAYYNLGVVNFKNRDYLNASKYLRLVNPNILSSAEKVETNFKIGFSEYARKRNKEAAKYFDLAKREEGSYYADANYYSGYLAYNNDNFDKALVDLKKAEATSKYKDKVPVMIASSYYKQERYDELFAYAEGLKGAEKTKRRINNFDQVYLLTAEALYQEERWKEATEYFGYYTKMASRNLSTEVLYRLGYAQYMDGQTDQAINTFKRVALNRGEIGQYASYYLGRLYVSQENFLFAASAFKKAGDLKFNKEIQEESAFNFAKVNFQAGKYSVVIQALDRFMKRYPASDYVPEANNLLSEAFLNTNDYSRAISFIERIENKSPRIQEAYQKVAFFKGTEFYNAARYANAVQMFNKSIQFPIDKDLETSAHFWKAEAFATAKAYDRAIQAYQDVFATRNRNSPYTLKANYGVAYAYFNSKDYKNARVYFKRYTDQLERAQDKQNYYDALIRLADCYYVDKAYPAAINAYQVAIDKNVPDADYAYFQKGVVRDFQDKNDLAIQSLDVVINRFRESRFYDDAVYKKAQIQLENGDYQSAIAGFTGLIDRLAQSPFIPYAYESRALAHFNLRNYDAAERDYKSILDKYITSRVANSALLGLQNTLTIQDKTLEFDQYLTKYRSANPENEALESIEFESAKNLYFSEQYNAAIGALEDYIKTYPESGLIYEANFYKAQCYYRLNNIEMALETYYDVYRDNRISGMDRVFEKIGELEIRQGKFQEAASFYSKLERIAKNKRQQSDAWSGLLESYYKLARYDSMRFYAKTIIEKGSVSQEAANKAQLYLGKAAYAEGDFDDAIDEFLTTLNTSKDAYGAEAQYMIGQIFYQRKQYRQSLNTLFEINENFSAYDEWLGKAFLLIADNYVALEEYFQARATLNSVIEYSSLKEIVDQAKKKLAEVEKLAGELEEEPVEADTTGNNKK